MTKSAKIALGVATLWPFAYLFVFFAFFFGIMINSPGPGKEAGIPLFMVVFFALHLFTMLLGMALTVFYMVNIFRNDRVDKDKKVLWAVVIFLGSMIAMPIYWYLYIWKEAAGPAPLPSALGSADSSSWVNNATTSAPQHEYVPPRQPPNWRE
jgi:hypothetical protein